jgi:hypothetical protein
MSEAFTLGEKSGVGQDMVLKLLKDMLPAPPYAPALHCW